MHDPARYLIAPPNAHVLRSVHTLDGSAHGFAGGATPMWGRLSVVLSGSAAAPAPEVDALTAAAVEQGLDQFAAVEVASPASAHAGVRILRSGRGYNGLVLATRSAIIASEGATACVDDPTLAVVSLHAPAAVALENGWVLRFARVEGNIEVEAWRRPGIAPELPDATPLRERIDTLEPDLRAAVADLIALGAAETIMAAAGLMMRHGPDDVAEAAMWELVKTGTFTAPGHWVLDWTRSISAGALRRATSGAAHWGGELLDTVEQIGTHDGDAWVAAAEQREQLEALRCVLDIVHEGAPLLARLSEIDVVAGERGGIVGAEEPTALLERAAALRPDAWWTQGAVVDLDRDEV